MKNSSRLDGNIDAEIMHAITLIRPLTGFLGLSFNPVILIKAVNYLHDIGFDKSLKALMTYCVLSRDGTEKNPENIFLIARVLFIRKDGQKILPRLSLGKPDIEDTDPSVIPLFPLYIQRDIPFLLISGYMIGGEGQPPGEYLNWCSRECKIMPAQLVPDNNPLVVADEFLESDLWRGLNPNRWHYWMLRLQALRAVSNVYPISKQEEAELLASATADKSWRRHMQTFESLNVTWNSKNNDFSTVK